MSSRLAKIAAVCALAGAIAGVLVGLGAGAGHREVAAAAYAIERPSSNGHSFLVRIDPRTLRPVGNARLDLGADAAPPSRSPDGTGAAFSAWPSAELRFVDLPRLRALGTVAAAGEGAFIKADGWLTADRLVALVQRNRGQYKSIVASREAVVVDPLARTVIGRVPVGDLRALLGSAQAGDKLVLLFGAGTLKHGPVWIGVIGVDGRFRETAIDIGRAPDRRSTALAVDAQGNHAYLFAAGASLAEVDLDTLQVTRHTIAGAPTLTTARGNSFRQLGWVDEHTLALGGANTVTAGGKETATGMGLALVDTRSWQARVIDSKASGFSISASTLVAFQWNGGGLTAYGLDGTRRFHRYDRQAVYANVFREVAVVSKPFGIGQPLVVGPNRMKSDVLSLATGRVIGRVPYNLQPLADPPNLRLAARTNQKASGNEEPLTVDGDGSDLTGHAADGVASVVALLLDGNQQPLTIDDSGDFSYQAAVPDQTARTLEALGPDGSLLASVDLLPAASPTAAPPTTTAPSTTAPAPHPNPPRYTVSNRGRRVLTRGRQPFFHTHSYALFLLGTLRGRAFYRVQVTAHFTCYGAGKTTRIGTLEMLGCPTVVGAYPLQSDDRQIAGRRGQPLHYERIDGIAVDQAKAMALIDGNGKRVATARVTNNLFAFPPPYPAVNKVRLVALDSQGRVLAPHPEWGQHQTPPANLFGPRATKVAPSALRTRIQQGSARGVHVTVGANGVVVFDSSKPDARTRKLLAGFRVGFNCFRLTENVRRTDSAGSYFAWQPSLALKVVGLKPPYDGCEIQGVYGHRWHDRYGTHSAVEVAFTQRAHRYFEDRAAARDLALFVRSRKMQQFRRQTGAVLRRQLVRQYGSAISFLAGPDTKPPVGRIGVWIHGDTAVFSETSSVGARFHVLLKHGKIVHEDVRGLAFVF